MSELKHRNCINKCTVSREPRHTTPLGISPHVVTLSLRIAETLGLRILSPSSPKRNGRESSDQ